jgi:hypothetical protein
MDQPLPKYHENPETFKDEPVYIFTDKAIVRPPMTGEQPPFSPTGQGQEQKLPHADQKQDS